MKGFVHHTQECFSMPTASKLVAAFCLSVTALIVSEMIKQNMPEGTQFGMFSGVNVLVGLVVGWVTVGSRAGRGFAAAVTTGLTGAVALVFWCLFVHACYEMTEQAMRGLYKSFFDAVQGIFELMLEFSHELLDKDIAIVLLLGGFLSGFVADFVSKRWS
jgi:hypothetical protein